MKEIVVYAIIVIIMVALFIYLNRPRQVSNPILWPKGIEFFRLILFTIAICLYIWAAHLAIHNPKVTVRQYFNTEHYGNN